MIKNDMTPHQYQVKFLESGVERTSYTDDRRYYERLVAQHGHLDALEIETLILTAAQQSRLDQIKEASIDAHDASLYVKYGTTETEDSGFFESENLEAYRKAMVEPHIRAQRKAAEASGVKLNGIRYSGDPSNRQAMQEAIMAANDSGSESFSMWKDSDGGYHNGHLLSDVRDALRKVGDRRSVLIALESLYVSQVADDQIDIHELDWTTEYD
jgi:hypothetical protein